MARVLPPESEWRRDDAIRCLECGVWKKALGRHLIIHDMTADEYRAAWGMRQRQPLSCGDLSTKRREIAIRTGGVDRLTEWAPKIADVAHAAAAKREHRPQERTENSAQSRALRERDRERAQARVARADDTIRSAGFASREAWLVEHYHRRGMTLAECDAALDVAHGQCQQWMKEAGIERRRPGPRHDESGPQTGV
ncbi:MucR family transcriptional regulator [Gordonia iterans]